MVARESRMIELGTKAPAFSLPDPSGRIYALDSFSGAPALLVAFICNHCPFVKHIAGGFAAFARDYKDRGLAVVAINSNDVATYPEDAPDKMIAFAKEQGFTFPYLYDESQKTALAYEAICTPDFFLFDKKRKLVYRGQFDASRPGSSVPVTGKDLRAAVDAVLAGQAPVAEQRPSIGCNIKWKSDNAPDWA
jgi:peroxiredoxin